MIIALIQSITNSFFEVTQEIKIKFLSNSFFLLNTIERKNYTSIARENNVLYDQVYINKEEAKGYIEYSKKYLIALINSCANKEDQGFLTIDFTNILKPYSEKIECTTYDYSGCTKRVEKSISLGLACWSNSKITIPLIENFFSKIKHFRRVFSRFDKSLRNYAAFLSLAGAILWLR